MAAIENAHSRIRRASRRALRSHRAGLQGKLISSFMGMLAVALGVSCWVFNITSREVADSLVTEQALELSRTLGMASQTPLARGNVDELTRIGRDLLKHRD